MPDRARYYHVAGITVRVESDLPITDATFDRRFAAFSVDGPGPDTIVIRHHFALPDPAPGLAPADQAVEVYRRPPWSVYRTRDAWVYRGIAPDPGDPAMHMLAIFTADHTSGDIYSPPFHEQLWIQGGLTALTRMPTDQILLARLLADREACLVHSAGLKIDQGGLLFVGHSEAGKSTTVQMARRRLGSRAEILCDDRTIVRRWSEGYGGGPPGFYLHGSWSHGDVPEVSAAGAPLKAVLLLERSDENELIALTGRKQIWPRLLATLVRPLATADWWDKQMSTLERLVDEIPCFTMRFDTSGAIVDELERLAR